MKRALYPKDKFPQGHPELAVSLINLGYLLKARGEFRKPNYPKDKFPQGHPRLASSLHNLGAILHVRGAFAQAEPFYREAIGMYQGHFYRVADAASEAEALNFAATFPGTHNAFLSITSRLSASASAYDVLWQSRSAGSRITERRHLDLLASRDKDCQKLFLELQLARQRVARQLLAPARKADEHAELLQKLTDEKEEVEKKLGGNCVCFNPRNLSKRSQVT